ncbi:MULTISPECIES: hypothetical protein [Pseudomonas aeruginosa group]|uniref:Uncharacterized protein n=1 Tax=Pseudomonas paraeruginosa TaxID=2994495 RepID=A0A2R3J1L3_9PSED|nr:MULTISPECIES: hypothetical protein [Pseudomonas aeruginosa group]AVK08043.1 hypothetical protein CSB93_4611 [Pseudomonas paraeruginosa]AWE90580.1 hypothetical protein CSC28_3399 [Pseudomonas paraeruginosa]KSD71311.1 hypothetical protein AO903_15410 [Pseudomonas aeruginosa]MCT9627988.1 hypothetical protein [Pseudomonas aeruginosa]MCW8027525.1 hypothetical protein [Pseudomonas aeruginosa]
MAFDAADYVHRYHASLEYAPGNEYPRLKAWEFLWEYIWDSRRSWDDLVAPEQLDTTALHLGFYLANWGMFRGSSGLLQNSNLDLMKALARQLFGGPGPELFELSLVDFAASAPRLARNQELLETVLGAMDTLSSRVSWTDTLKSKILLGVWGEFPALDRYYVAACRALYPRRAHLTRASGKTLTALHGLIGAERLSFPRLETARQGLLYPTGRLADMAFFQYGLEHA